jgi:hypothetical protein
MADTTEQNEEAPDEMIVQLLKAFSAFALDLS